MTKDNVPTPLDTTKFSIDLVKKRVFPISLLEAWILSIKPANVGFEELDEK